MDIRKTYVNGTGAVSAAGIDVPGHIGFMKSGKSAIAFSEHIATAVHSPVGEVRLSDTELKEKLGISADETVSRTALLGLVAVLEALDDCESRGISLSGARVALVSGTSVGGMDLSEVFWQSWRGDIPAGDVRMLAMHDPGAVTSYMAEYLRKRRLAGDISFVSTVSTACSAAGNAMILGARLLRAGLVDAVIAGGTDALCRFTMNGFNSLRILDEDVCRPFDASRAGLNLGEGAGYVVLTANPSNAGCILSGWGNANEAYHQTASTPEGIGPGLAMEKALSCARLSPEDIGFINTHGTGTQVNDMAEGNAMLRVFGGKVPPFSSLKAYFGHTLGASEGIEAALVCRALESGDCSFMKSIRFSEPVPETGLRPYAGGELPALSSIMSSAFGFSGNCVSLIFSRL